MTYLVMRRPRLGDFKAALELAKEVYEAKVLELAPGLGIMPTPGFIISTDREICLSDMEYLGIVEWY